MTLLRARARLVESVRRVRALARAVRGRRELDDEMRFHLEMLERDYEHAGMSPAAARDAARRRFGNALALRERSEDVWRWPALDTALQDLRFGARLLRRSPAFAAVAVCAIGVAMAVNCGVFTLIDALVWRPIPVRDPSSLVMLHPVDERGATWNLLSYPDFAAVRTDARTLAGAAAVERRVVALSPAEVTNAGGASADVPGPLGPSEPTVVTAALVSGNYFALLGARAAAGRTLVPADEDAGAPPVVVLGERFWARHFAASRDAIGRTVLVNGARATVVGVAPRDFTGTEPRAPDVWLPVTLAGAERLAARGDRWLAVHGRLRAGVAPRQAAAELSTIVRRLATAQPARGDAVSITLTPQSSWMPLGPEQRALLAPAMIPVVLVLVIACANLATLLLARAMARQREVAIRLAVGASRWRLVRQLLTESLLVAVLGAALGLVLADWGLGAIARSVIASLPPEAGTIVLDLHPGARVFAYTACLVLVSALVFGLAPALQATATDLAAQMKGEDRTFGTRIRRSRFRDWLVAAQVAACAVLLVAAGTLVESVRHLLDARSGVEPERVAVAQLGLAADGRVTPRLAAARAALAAGAATLPGVAGVARVADVPFAGPSRLVSLTVDGSDTTAHLLANVVTPSYFAVVGQRVLRGRTFTTGESAAGARTAVLTEAAARRLWPRRSALGQRVRIARGGGDDADSRGSLYEVVGVVANARTGRLWETDEAYLYLPATPDDLASADMPLLVGLDGRLRDVDPALRRLAREIDRSEPLRLTPLTDALGEQLLPFRYAAVVASGVGALGLLLAAIGLYGVIAFAVQQRTRDIAVHVAFGATGRDVLRLVLRREMRLVLAGLGLGLLLSAGEARLLGAIVVPLHPLGPTGWVALAAFLTAVAAVAVVAPARRALRIQPMRVLRSE